ncbi:cytochrome c oxidase assembly protein [Vibrio algivorus]|uniref:Cytochrome c oxidase assembly protein CtaG n=1 Tax=Vibrio algivorus TaxID=1667024 RepID=A0A557P4X3_9VIBR|nr:cytochrome c oxidase assembly protein [Vibrio algivorus]TVO35716.1 cytochrome c oxidase assembly protein [Vibrio algivorus]
MSNRASNSSPKHNENPKSNSKLIGYLLLSVVSMFGFGFALVPLYDIMCEQLGINGKTNTEAASSQGIQVDTSRLVRVQFMSQVSPNMPWKFEPAQVQMDVHPGQVIRTSYRAVNNSNVTMIGQAVPSVAPGLAATHFNKIECFCFNHQPLQANTEAELPVIFYVDKDLPSSVNRLTLSYTLYDITESSKSSSQPEPQLTLKPVEEVTQEQNKNAMQSLSKGAPELLAQSSHSSPNELN